MLLLIAASPILLAACGEDHSEHLGGEGAHGGVVPGGAASASEAERKIEVVASDNLRFEPRTIDVSAGEVVTFVVKNEGDTDHEFVLGDAAYQEAHAEGMSDGDHMATEGALEVKPGETAELTWRFDEAGDVLFGCHEPGHYEGGMVGTISVE